MTEKTVQYVCYVSIQHTLIGTKGIEDNFLGLMGLLIFDIACSIDSLLLLPLRTRTVLVHVEKSYPTDTIHLDIYEKHQ